MSVCMSVCVSVVCPSAVVCLFVGCLLPACLPACLPARLPACLPARPPARPPVCPPARPPQCLSAPSALGVRADRHTDGRAGRGVGSWLTLAAVGQAPQLARQAMDAHPLAQSVGSFRRPGRSDSGKGVTADRRCRRAGAQRRCVWHDQRRRGRSGGGWARCGAACGGLAAERSQKRPLATAPLAATRPRIRSTPRAGSVGSVTRLRRPPNPTSRGSSKRAGRALQPAAVEGNDLADRTFRAYFPLGARFAGS